jgi:two-component system sensor histidine kinase DegS
VGRLALTKRLLRLISRPAFWFILIVLILITLPHYAEALEHPSFISVAIYKLGLSRHAFERILYLAPIAWAGFIFGWRMALAVSITALILMLPRAIYLSPYPRDALFETFAVFIIGNVLAISFASLRKEREYRTQLEIARQGLQKDAEQLREMQKNLRFYLNQVTRAQEEERKRISHELHDETIQALVSLSRKLDGLATKNRELPEEYRQGLEDLWQQTNNIIRDVRRLSQDLRPAALDRLGLLPALEWLADDVAKYSGISTKVNVKGTARRLPEDVELVLFRITQEALRNVWRHAQATQAKITVEFDDNKTKISISDNGKGFEPPPQIDGLARDGKLGLAGMHERAELIGGSIKVSSEKGKGATITVEVPV